MMDIDRLAVSFRERERDVALPSTILEEAHRLGSEIHEVGLFTMEHHLSLVNLSLIKDLIDKDQKPLCVMVDSIKLIAVFLVCDTLLQLLQRTEDKRQRGADIVGGIDEEPHLLLVILHFTLAL